MTEFKYEFKDFFKEYSSGLLVIDLNSGRRLLLSFLCLLREYGFIKMCINEKNNTIDVFFPIEIYEIVKASIKNNKQIKTY